MTDAEGELAFDPYRSPSEEIVATVVSAEIARPRPWGPWATLGWGLLIFFAWLVAQTIVAVAFLVVQLLRTRGANLDEFVQSMESSGLLLGLSTCVTAPIWVLLCVFVARLRHYPALEYLGLGPLRRNDVLLGLGCLVVFIPASDLSMLATGREIVPPFMVEAYHSAGWLPLLVLALVAGAPLGEEVFFRGFLYRGWSESRLGPLGAILLTSVWWGVIHIQYDWFGILHVAVLGLIFGWLRWKTGSTTLTILLHAIANFVATVEAVVKIEWMS